MKVERPLLDGYQTARGKALVVFELAETPTFRLADNLSLKFIVVDYS